ncbi:hypothetical protein [Myceligenerans halotolerans]
MEFLDGEPEDLTGGYTHGDAEQDIDRRFRPGPDNVSAEVVIAVEAIGVVLHDEQMIVLVGMTSASMQRALRAADVAGTAAEPHHGT